MVDGERVQLWEGDDAPEGGGGDLTQSSGVTRSQPGGSPAASPSKSLSRLAPVWGVRALSEPEGGKDPAASPSKSWSRLAPVPVPLSEPEGRNEGRKGSGEAESGLVSSHLPAHAPCVACLSTGRPGVLDCKVHMTREEEAKGENPEQGTATAARPTCYHAVDVRTEEGSEIVHLRLSSPSPCPRPHSFEELAEYLKTRDAVLAVSSAPKNWGRELNFV